MVGDRNSMKQANENSITKLNTLKEFDRMKTEPNYTEIDEAENRKYSEEPIDGIIAGKL